MQKQKPPLIYVIKTDHTNKTNLLSANPKPRTQLIVISKATLQQHQPNN